MVKQIARPPIKGDPMRGIEQSMAEMSHILSVDVAERGLVPVVSSLRATVCGSSVWRRNNKGPRQDVSPPPTPHHHHYHQNPLAEDRPFISSKPSC
jgi:hypothetical protein